MSDTYSAQAIAKAIVPKIPGLLSAFASAYVIYDILRRKRGKGNRNRLLIGLSISDIVGSISFGFVSSWAIPKGTPGVFLAAGNDATCKAQGFLLQLCNTTSPLYSGSLAFYYLVTLTKGWSEDDVKKYTYFLHGIPIFFGVTTAVIGLILNLYHPVGLWCWFGPPGPHYDAFRWGMAHSFIWSSIFFGTFVMVKLYQKVRRLERKTERYSIFQINEGNSYLNQTQEGRKRRPMNGGIGSFTFNKESSTRSVNGSIVTSDRGQGEQHKPTSTISVAINGSVLSRGEEKKRRRSRDVAIQGILFTGAYFLAYIGGFLTRLVQCITGKVYFELIIIMAALLPAQGIFNFIVYMRPRWRSEHNSGHTRQRNESTPRIPFALRRSFSRMQNKTPSYRSDKASLPGKRNEDIIVDTESMPDDKADNESEGDKEDNFVLEPSEDGETLKRADHHSVEVKEDSFHDQHTDYTTC